MSDAPALSEPLLRFAGARPEDGSRAAVPWRLALALRDYAYACGLKIDRLERSRNRASGSSYILMTDALDRGWIMRVSNHRRGPRQTSHATPHLDLVSLDGTSGLAVGRKLIDAIIADTAPWFDAGATIRPLPQIRRNVRRRRR